METDRASCLLRRNTFYHRRLHEILRCFLREAGRISWSAVDERHLRSQRCYLPTPSTVSTGPSNEAMGDANASARLLDVSGSPIV
jgi:hypothetical protein